MQSRSPTADEVQTLIDAVELTPGPPGLSAYEVAVVNGFNGNEAQFIASLKGAPGDDAEPAAPGASAYQIAVAQGFVGTVNEWLASLKGPAGDSAYQVALSDGFVGTKTDWLASLKGEPGSGGGGGTGAAAPIFEARYNGPDIVADVGDYTTVPLQAITRFPAANPANPIANEPTIEGGQLVRLTPGFYDITGVVEFADGSPTMQIMLYPYGASPEDDRINPAAVGAINAAIFGGYAKGAFSGSFRVTTAATYMLLVYDTTIYRVKTARVRIQRADQSGAGAGGGGTVAAKDEAGIWLSPVDPANSVTLQYAFAATAPGGGPNNNPPPVNLQSLSESYQLAQTFGGQGSVTLNGDGTFSVDAAGLYEIVVNTGGYVTNQSFQPITQARMAMLLYRSNASPVPFGQRASNVQHGYLLSPATNYPAGIEQGGWDFSASMAMLLVPGVSYGLSATVCDLSTSNPVAIASYVFFRGEKTGFAVRKVA